jgi:poly(3-hydroxybutyrate) depolymerase
MRTASSIFAALTVWAFCCNAESPSPESFMVETSSPQNRVLKFSFRTPATFTSSNKGECRIMILFGGRNWDSDRTLAAYRFGGLADRRKLFLLSPSFKDDDYWEPEKWSGEAMLAAVAELRRRYALPEGKLLYYGYSAGGQCANLFMAWKPELVEAWGGHACGVWHAPRKFATPIPALITCGEEDEGRVQTSMSFAQSYRECGNPAILKLNLGGHELPDSALKLAEAFFDSALSSPDGRILFIGDDQRMKYFPADSKEVKAISPELRDEFYNESIAKLWQGIR